MSWGVQIFRVNMVYPKLSYNEMSERFQGYLMGTQERHMQLYKNMLWLLIWILLMEAILMSTTIYILPPDSWMIFIPNATQISITVYVIAPASK